MRQHVYDGDGPVDTGELRVKRALQDSAEFADQLYRYGVSHVLSVIATESMARKDDFAPLRAFVEEIIDSADGGEVAFANLNYDALLTAAICRDYNDDLLLAYGRLPNAYHYITDDDLALGRPLRTQGKLPYRRFTLLHLHGVAGVAAPPRKWSRLRAGDR